MFVVSEAETTAIRDAFHQRGEFAAAVDLRRLFPGIASNRQARECVRISASGLNQPAAALSCLCQRSPDGAMSSPPRSPWPDRAMHKFVAMARSGDAVARVLVANEKRAEAVHATGWGITMVHRVSLALTAVLLSSAAAAAAAELPTFEVIGFPLTQHQLTVLNSGIVQERSSPSLTLASMPASPIQIGVLTPRSKQEFAAKEGSTVRN